MRFGWNIVGFIFTDFGGRGNGWHKTVVNWRARRCEGIAKSRVLFEPRLLDPGLAGRETDESSGPWDSPRSESKRR